MYVDLHYVSNIVLHCKLPHGVNKNNKKINLENDLKKVSRRIV